jgi:hypothetical protein
MLPILISLAVLLVVDAVRQERKLNRIVQEQISANKFEDHKS